VTTHWLMADELADRHPDVEVDADPIYIKDGNVWTSAGVSSGVDLALALVAGDHGHRLARDVACGLVVYLHRPGGQSQFSTPMRAGTPRSQPLRQLQAFIDANPAEDLSVPALARRTGMSERHFSRVFTDQTGLHLAGTSQPGRRRPAAPGSHRPPAGHGRQTVRARRTGNPLPRLPPTLADLTR
jgi:transcriptional regulator GlxA family with amidase domain